MDTSLIAGTLSIVANNGLTFANFLNGINFVSNLSISATDSIADQIPPSIAAGSLQISAALFPVATIAPPPVKSISRRSASRTFLRRKRRTKRRLYGDDSEGGEDSGFGGGSDDNGSYGGDGGRGSGGGGWNFDGFGGDDWDESSSSSSNPAYHFVYEVVYWIALSNCVHFAFKKVVRFAGDAIDNTERRKLSMRLISIY